MPRFSREFVRDLADRVSIVEVVGRHVRLARKGTRWVGLCPFHSEKTPSFGVNEARKIFKCFGCGEVGNAIDFIMKIEGLGFVEAVSELAERAGVPLPKEDLDPREVQEAARRDRLHHANEVAAKWFEQSLSSEEGVAGRAHLQQREMPEEIVRGYRLGMAPDSWDGLLSALRRAGVDGRTAEEAGLIVPRKGGEGWYDRFRNRLMFPITGAGGKVVAFGGRTLGNDDAKYINSPESPIYNKSATLYGLHEGRQAIHKEDRVLLVEGYFDVLGLARAGLGFAVAPCGTALTERQLIAVRRHTRNVTALFDSDAAGKKAGMRALELCLDQGLWPQWLAVPDGKDPDDFVRAHGGDAMRELLKSARPLIDVYLEDRLAAAGSDLPSRDAVLKDLLPMLGKLGESVRRGYVYQVAGALNLDPIETERRARQGGATRGTPVQAAPASAPASAPARAPASAPAAVPAPSRPKASAPERELLKLLVQDLAQMAPLVDEKGLVSFVRHPDVERAVGVMLRAWREGREPDGIELLADIADDEVRHELSSVLADEDSWYSADVRAKARHECVYRLASDWIAQRRAGLAAEIARIERQSPRDTARLRELITESAAFDRQRHTLLRQLLPDALQGRLGEA